MKKILLLLSLAVLLFACTPKADTETQSTDDNESGDIYTESVIMPDFTLLDIDGNEVSLYERLDAGQTVIVDFWALWCVPCLKLLPHLSDFADKYENVEVLALSQDSKRQSAKAAEKAKAEGWNVTTLLDPNGEVKELLEVGVIPETFYVKPNREIHFHHQGYKDGSEVKMEKILKELLESYDN
ncbi:MAG: TlpA disulfide reductase family protein [Candidatus Cloacimonadales bacterium]